MPDNPFGPQTANAVTSLPSGNTLVRFGSNETWCKPCDPVGKGGTVLDAGYFNNIHGNLNYVVRVSGLSPAKRGDMSVLHRSIMKLLGDAASQPVTGAFGTPVGYLIT